MIILGTNSIKDTGYDVDNSLRFESGNGDYIRRANTGTDFSASGSKLFTYSVWVKRAKLSSFMQIYAIGSGGGRDYSAFDGNDRIEFAQYNSGVKYQLTTNRVFRDTTAWYHLVFAVDTTNGTANNRARLYVNGIEETSFSTRTNASSGQAIFPNTQCDSYVLGSDTDFNNDFSGYFSEVCYVSGSQETATPFGEFDEDNGIWKPKTITATLASDSFLYEFKDSSALGADTSGLGNSAGVINGLTAIDQSTDTCTNNFATLNPLTQKSTSFTIINGNLETNGVSSNGWRGMISTIAVSSGKWYFETKVNQTESSDPMNIAFGIVDIDQFSQTADQEFYHTSRGYGYHGNQGKKGNNNNLVNYGNSYTVGDIIGCAFDLDNNKIYFSKNGTFQNSGNPTSGSSGTGSAFDITDGYTYTPSFSSYFNNDRIAFNFGSPPFSISSGNTDGNGYGNFEYAVPSGYYSLNTKNLAEYG